MSNRLARIVLGTLVGSIGVGIGLYFGRFVAAAAALPFAASRQAIPLATGAAWWAFVGLIGGLGLAFAAVNRGRVLFVLVSIVGFALGGVIAALPEAGRVDRSAALSALAVPIGGGLAGLLIGLAARLKARSALMLIAGVAALAIAAPHIDPRGSAIPRPIGSWQLSDWLALLAPGAIIGGTLAALAPEREEPPLA